MFGKKKKEDEKKEGKAEQEDAAAAQPGTEAQPAAADGGLSGLKNLSSSPANDGGDAKAASEEKKEAQEKPAASSEEKPVQPEPENAPSAAPARAEEPAPEEEDVSLKPHRRKGADPEMERLKKQLATQRESMKAIERERAEAMKKSEELAGLIEDLSNEIKEVKSAPEKHRDAPAVQMPDIEPKLRAMEEKTAAQIGGIKEALEALAQKKDEEKKDEEDVAATMKKMFEKRMKDIYDKLEEVKVKPAQIGGGDGEISGGLSAIGGGIELKKEIDGLKKSVKDLATLVDAFKEEAENRFMALDRELSALDRFPNLEQKMEQFEKKLGPENVQKLRTLISSADDLKEEVIPLVVKRVVEDKVEPHTRKVKDVLERAEKIDKALSEFSVDAKAIRKDIDSLYKFGERLGKIEDDSGAMKKSILELRNAMKELDKSQKKEMLDKIKELFPPMLEAEAVGIRKEFAGRFSFFSEKLHSLDNMLSENHKEIAALSALKGENDSIADRLDDVDEKMEKMAIKMEALRAKDEDLLDKIEDLETPKEVITQLDNKTKDILDIREFFVRRANQLEERINQLDERAAPTRKLHESFEKLAAEFAAMKDTQRKIEAKMAEETRQYQQILAHQADEKKRVEEKINEQKARISTLLKEFR